MKIECISIVVVAMSFFMSISCSYEQKLLHMSPSSVSSISPASGSIGVDPNAAVTIVFNTAMSTTITEDSFSVTYDDGNDTVAGYFTWSDGNKAMTFHPSVALTVGQEYTVKVTTGAEDTYGNDLNNAWMSTFYVGTGLVGIYPQVIAASPTNNQTGVSQNQVISFTFNGAMNIDSAYAGITINPVVNAAYNWSQGNTQLSIVPYTGLTEGTTYTVSLNAGLLNASGNALQQSETYSFTVGGNFITPTITQLSCSTSTGGSIILLDELANHPPVTGVDKDSTFKISFNDTMNCATATSSITFSPTANFYITEDSQSNSTLTLTLLDPLTINTMYTLTVSKTMADVNGSTLSRSYIYQFMVNGTNSIAPTVSCMTDMNTWTIYSPTNGTAVPYADMPNQTSGQYWTAGSVQPVIMQSGLSVDTVPSIYVVFSKSVMPESVTVAASATVGSASLSVVNPVWFSSTDSSGNVIPYSIYKFDLNGLTTGLVIQLTIKGGTGGVTDTDGNTMASDYIQYIRN